MRIIKTISIAIQIILVVILLGNVVCGDPTPATAIHSHGINNAIIYMFLLLGIAAVTQIYEMNKIGGK